MRKIIILSILCLFLLTSLCFSKTDNKQYVENLIKTKTAESIKIIKDKKLSDKEKKNQIYKLVSPLFDFKIMSMLTLGKKYWGQFNKKEKEKFTHLFAQRIKLVYLDRMSLTKDLTVQYKPAIVKNKKIIYIPSTFTTKGKDYSVLFKLWHSSGGWKIYDVVVSGISIVRTYSSQFQSILNKGGIKELFKKLESSGK
jgi:phospholipid transport system substrate-binding protein